MYEASLVGTTLIDGIAVFSPVTGSASPTRIATTATP